MPKKEKVWTMGSNGPIGPWVWHVWVKGKKKAIRIVAFDKNHIQDQLEGESIQKIEKLPEPKEKIKRSMPLGPKGAKISRPADYDNGFKVLRAWVDEHGGPPEEIRKKLRELYIDYDKAPQKTTTYSARKKTRHKI
jgi:hypothetical protein|tara:strand:- start:227 stop:634 length:408 start_codon:yes stop_codon:yes gene_type:complete